MNFRSALFILGATLSSNGVGVGVLAFAPHAPASVISLKQSRTSTFASRMSKDAEGSDSATAELSQGVNGSEKAKNPDFALLFDCDGVILETEELHRLAYNAAFSEFNVTKVCGDVSEPVEWSVGYYDILQNSIGGGIPKMRHYFSQLLRFESNENGDPTTILATLPGKSSNDKGFAPPPSNKKKKKKNGKQKKTNSEPISVIIAADDIATGLESLIESIQTRKTELYKTTVEESATPRPGLVELMDEALADENIAVGVCSASTKAAAQKVLECTLGPERVSKLDVCILGDDVSEKKPSPMIYNAAREKLGIDLATKCVVVEDSAVGLRAAKAAGMRCLITYTASTTNEDFYGMGADAKVPDLANNGNPVTLKSIFAPLREAFPSEEDQYPELLVGLKDEPLEEDEEEYDEEDNLIWNTAMDDGFILLEEDESDENVVEIVLDDDNLVSEDEPVVEDETVAEETTNEGTEESTEDETPAVEEEAPIDEEGEAATEETPVVEEPEATMDEDVPVLEEPEAMIEEVEAEEPAAVAEEEPEDESEVPVEEEPMVEEIEASAEEEPEAVAEPTPEAETPPPAPEASTAPTPSPPRRILKPKMTQDDMGNFSM